VKSSTTVRKRKLLSGDVKQTLRVTGETATNKKKRHHRKLRQKEELSDDAFLSYRRGMTAARGGFNGPEGSLCNC